MDYFISYHIDITALHHDRLLELLNDTKQELISQLENHLTEDEILDVDLETLNANLDDLVCELDSIAPMGI